MALRVLRTEDAWRAHLALRIFPNLSDGFKKKLAEAAKKQDTKASKEDK